MYTEVSILGLSVTGSLLLVDLAAVCSSAVGSTGSYSSGFISRSGRELDSSSKFVSA